MKSLACSPNNAKYLHNIGICHKISGNIQEALIYFKLSISNDPNNPIYPFNLADIYNSMRQYDDEIACYK